VIEIKLALIFGTRPEIIRLSPMIRYLESVKDEKNIEFFLIHTGQHYDYDMDKIFFDELNLPSPKYNLNVGSGSQAEQFSKMGVGIEKILLEESPDASLVYGDTNTTLSGAITSVKLGIPIIHIEAGCRSFDMNMPEEINRVCTDHISRMLFPPDNVSEQNLKKEGICEDKIFGQVNPLIDACNQNSEIAKKKSKILEKLNLKGDYAVMTLHRQENVDNKERLVNLLDTISNLNLKVIFPIHPRTEKMIKRFELEHYLKKFVVIQPLGYIDFLKLIENSKMIFTDSGGVQIEANILGKPCIVTRDTTEWTNEIKGMSFLVSDKKDMILNSIEKINSGTMKRIDYSKYNNNSETIVKACIKEYENGTLKLWKKSMIEGD